VDAAVANRVVPAGDDPWRASWAAAQAGRLAEIAADVDPLPVLTVPYAAGEPVGVPELRDLAAAVYADRDPLDVLAEAPSMSVERVDDLYVLVLPLPLAARGEVDVARRGDELLVSWGTQRRALALPSALRRCTLAGAALRDGALRVRFSPDPDLWRRP
jgi:arsenite-transporting ATPase